MADAYNSQNVVDLRLAASVGLLEDPTPILDFIRKDGLATTVDNLKFANAKPGSRRAVSMWVSLASVTEKIAFFLEDETSLQTKLAMVEQSERLVEFYIKLCANLKPAYIAFAAREPEIVIAVLKVLGCCVQMRNRRVTAEFMERFDFANTHFHQLFVPSRDNFDLTVVSDASMRYAVVEFWLSLSREVNSSLKMTMLTNFSVMNQFWKYLDMERCERLNEILAFLDEHVLGELNFKRSTKCRILNENALLSLRSLFALVSKTPRERDTSDEHEFASFKSGFVAFMTTLVSDRRRGLLFPINQFGSSLSINGTVFSINNKLLHTLLVSLKPWEDNVQMGFAMTMLNSASELVSPYMAWLVANSGGYHEPLLSSFWVGRSLLYLEILKSSHIPFSYQTVALLPLSKQAMTSCLAYPNDLVKQIALEIVLMQLKKVQAASNVSALLVESIVSNLPAYTTLMPLLTHSNRIIKLTATSIVALLESVAPRSSSSAIVSLVGHQVSTIDLHSCSSFDLVLLDKYLAIQSNNELKWWNKSGTHTFFTALLVLSKNAFLKIKVRRILDRLVKQSLAFGPHLVESPVLVLINTLSKTDSDAIYNLLDETISRCLKSPYKYLDQSNASYERTSIFLVVLFEQLAYLRKNSLSSETVEAWVRDFVSQMILIGEPQSGVQKLLAASGFEFTPDFSFLKLKNVLVSNLDFAETVTFLNGLKKPKSDLLFDTISRLGDYCMGLQSSDPALRWVSDPSTFRFLDFSSKLSESNALAISLYNELLKQLNAHLEGAVDLKKLASLVFKALAEKQKTRNQNVLKSMLWMLSEEQLMDVSANFDNELVVLKVYELFLERNVSFNPDLDHFLEIESPQVNTIVENISFSALSDVAKVYSKPELHFVFCKGGKNKQIFEDFLMTASIDDSLLYQIASLYPKLAAKHMQRVGDLAKSMGMWQHSISIFTSYPDTFQASDIAQLVLNDQNSTGKNSMTALFAKFVGTLPANVSPKVDVWFHRAMLYMTRKFAECSELSANFYDFLVAVDEVAVKTPSVLTQVPPEILQAQAEVVLGHSKWVRTRQCLAHVHNILAAKLNCDKLLQVFITNPKMVLCELPEEKETDLRKDSAQLLRALFKGVKPTEGLLKQVVVLYNGTMTPEDLVLKEVLVEMEAKLMVSWIVHVTDWDFIDELKDHELELVGRVKLITNNKTSFTVTLNKNYIMNTADGHSSVYAGERYDPEFLIQLILNNHELVSEVDGQLEFELEGIIGSHILRFIVSSLANPAIRDHCIVFMHGMLKFLERITKVSEKKEPEEDGTKTDAKKEEEAKKDAKAKKHHRQWKKDEVKQPKQGWKSAKFRHKGLLKIYIASILHTVKVADHGIPVVWSMVASFSMILANPGHFMYDRVNHYILSSPVIKDYDLPLFKPIMLFIRTEKHLGEDNYYRQVAWFVDQLARGVRSEADLKILQQREVMEWILNVMNMTCVQEGLRNKILGLVYRIQSVSLSGGEMLVTRYGALTSLEAMKLGNGALTDSALLNLNLDQVALRFGLLSEASKRIREWTFDEALPAVKRIHN